MATRYVEPALTDDGSAAQRAGVYRLFATLFGRELTMPDLAVLRRLTGSTSEAAESDELAGRLADLVSTLPADLDADGLLTLREEFTRLFIGAGGAPTASPYESTYRGERHLYGSAAIEMQDLLTTYRRAAPPEIGPPDHLSVELSLMATLVEDTRANADAVQVMQERLLAWVPALAARVRETSRLPVYPALAEALLAFLRGDAAYLDGLRHEAHPVLRKG